LARLLVATLACLLIVPASTVSADPLGAILHDFALHASPTHRLVAPGSEATFTITVNATLEATVHLEIANGSNGTNGSLPAWLDQTTLSSSFGHTASTTLHVLAPDADGATGEVTVRGTSEGGAMHSVTVQVATTAPPSFELRIDPSDQTAHAPSSTGNSTGNATGNSTSNSTAVYDVVVTALRDTRVDLRIVSVPNGTSGSLSPTSLNLTSGSDGHSTLTLRLSPGARSGDVVVEGADPFGNVLRATAHLTVA
jgi:hypothetical protein